MPTTSNPLSIAEAESISPRLWAKAQIVEGDCWTWQGATAKGKYGVIGRGGRKLGNVVTHVVAYVLKNGPVPNGMQVDHTCRTTLCVNPDHLEAVTQAENLRRQQLAITHCSRGHEFTQANTYTPPGTKKRQCRACIKRRTHEQAAKRRLEQAGADVSVWRPRDWPDRVTAELKEIA